MMEHIKTQVTDNVRCVITENKSNVIKIPDNSGLHIILLVTLLLFII